MKPTRTIFTRCCSSATLIFITCSASGQGGGTAQGGTAKGDTMGILDLARAVKPCQSEERFDLIGAHHQIDMI